MDGPIPPEVYADDQRTTVVASVVFCVLFTATMVGLRIYTRTKIIRLCGVDDYLAVASLFATTSCGVIIALMTTHGLGRHIMILSPQDIKEYMKLFYISMVCYSTAILLIKLSFLCQYYRVMAAPKLRKIYSVALLIVGAWSTSQLFITAFACIPASGFWDKSIHATCLPSQPQLYINAAGNIITDVAVFVLPMPVFWQLNLPRKQKLLLISIFSLGFFTVAISIIRVQFLDVPADFTWTNVEGSLWSLGELSSAVTCACLPTLRPLLTDLFPELMSRVNRTTIPSRRTDPSQHTDPPQRDMNRAYSGLPRSGDLEKGIADLVTPTATSIHGDNDCLPMRESTTYSQQPNESRETVYGLASALEDTITPVHSDPSAPNSRSTWSSSSHAK